MEEKILVVDDERAIRMSISCMIKWMGFEVRAAESGERAVHLFKENAFDLVLTDLHMPGMDGKALARTIKQISPTTPVILLTGDPEELTGERPVGDSVDMALSKPVMLSRLKETISRILG